MTPPFQPIGGFKVPVVDRQLPLVVAAEDPVSGKTLGKPLAAPAGAGFKVVKIQSRGVRGEVAFPPLLVVAVHAAPKHIQHLGLGAFPLDDQVGPGTGQLPREGDAKMDGGAVGNGSQRDPDISCCGN